jgi:pilus assembly protein Flp/PilA
MEKEIILFENLYEDESGQGMVEYALIIALVAVALITVLGLLNGGIQNTFNNIINKL